MSRRRPHEVLGVGPSPTAAELRAAWRRRAAETHPDRTGGSGEAFLEVQAAFRILSGLDADPELRRRYGEDPESVFEVEIARERHRARRKRRRARVAKLYE